MDLDGYKINNEYYCPNCAREYCLYNLCSVLTESEMVRLMPTKKLGTELLIKLMNRKGGDRNGSEIIPFAHYDFSDNLKRIKYLSELENFEEKQCANYNEFNHPHPFVKNSIYR
jgi:hypothetical protein